ncbi:hypothetical protein ACTXN7_11660 [Corynebacterium flavescens]|uniref:hypothetical protein n=1 Tax=Corynebacterium flavescens TaxID=28028 RepID=UPI003FCF347B
MDGLVLASAETSFLSDMQTWDMVFVVGALVAVWAGWSARANAVEGVFRAGVYVVMWSVLFVGLMFFGGILGAASESYVNR